MTVAFQMLYCRGSATFTHGILLSASFLTVA